MSKVLMVGFPKKSSARLTKIFSSVGVKTEDCDSFNSAFEKIPIDPPSLILANKPDDIQSLQSLDELLHAKAPATPFLVGLRKSNIKEAMASMRAGAYDCLVEPFDRFQVLAASKRAVNRSGHALFVQKVIKKKSPVGPITGIFFGFLVALVFLLKTVNGPPPRAVFLGSANLSGIQWEGRTLWVSDWYEATVTEYELLKGVLQNSRSLRAITIYHAQDSQPILVTNTPEAIVTVGSDLKIRRHQRAVGLPVLEAQNAPSTNPTGLVWDGSHIWSSDGQTDLLYKHGEDLRVIETAKSILSPTLGLTYAEGSFWVMGGKPLKLAKLTFLSKGAVWEGPYPIADILTEGMTPSGLSVAFGRLWLVSGGDPRVVSRRLVDIQKTPSGWTAEEKKK